MSYLSKIMFLLNQYETNDFIAKTELLISFFSTQPIGALNPKRAAFYAKRYETREDDQTPPCHYNSHYSTAATTLHWLVRIVSYISP